MSLILTIYQTPVWKTFAEACGLPLVTVSDPQTKDAAVLEQSQPLSSVSALLSLAPSEQTLWIAVVQAEYFLADALENGRTLAEASKEWMEQTDTLLDLQRKQRRKLRLFNLHQALSQPIKFRDLVSATLTIKEMPEQTINSNYLLLAACQFVNQQAEIKAANTRMQASVLPLYDNAVVNLSIEEILLQHRSLTSALQDHSSIKLQLEQLKKQLEAKESNERKLLEGSKERDKATQDLAAIKAEHQKAIQKNKQLEADIKSVTEERELILKQLLQVQEQLEQYYMSLQKEQQENKHALLARDKQHAKEVSKLDAELRKVKAKAANAEYAGLLLQKELDKLRTSISWKAATPVRAVGRLLKKNDPARDQLLQQIGLLLTSEYFDVDWYLKTYTDVAESQMNPAEHYLSYGALEGRLPGPLFDGNWYLTHYPDVAEAKINPLLHFITHGQAEGRTSSPMLLTNHQSAEE